MAILPTQNRAFEHKYAPRKIKDVLFVDPSVKLEVDQYIAGKTLKPIIFFGPNGTGKSTLANLLPYEMVQGLTSFDVLDLNSFDQSDSAKIRQQIWNFTSVIASNSSNIRFVIMDEMDTFPKPVIQTLKSAINKFSHAVLFIAMTNNLISLDKGHRSRANCLQISPTNLNDWLPRINYILKAENVPVPTSQALGNMLANSHGDNRQFLSDLERYVNRVRAATPPPPPPPKKKAIVKMFPKPKTGK
jgi:DNA polymerase III delta prime subunit